MIADLRIAKVTVRCCKNSFRNNESNKCITTTTMTTADHEVINTALAQLRAFVRDGDV